LCALHLSAAKAGRPLTWSSLPACLVQNARLAGLPDTFFRSAPAPDTMNHALPADSP